MKPKNKSSLEKILEEITPEQQARMDAKMLLAARIADAMEAKGWNNKMLMKALGKKNPSEITRWLSGTHNFTVDTLTDLGRVLGIDFINLSTEKEQPVQQFNISVLTYSDSSGYSSSVLNEADELSTYQKTHEQNLFNIKENESR
ncbi:MAG: helix-turn-helix transcriptional regulator [Eubacteriales bacterium]|nr:helix-turn-helix transcriptional regulator [Eubacteriales bacterium]